jgi:vacuolar-type H+-ATPase subunit F/Vma7
MRTAVALGDSSALDGFALVGATVIRTASDAEVVDAWDALGDEVALVVLTPDAARVVGERCAEHPDRLTVVMP